MRRATNKLNFADKSADKKFRTRRSFKIEISEQMWLF